MFALEHALLVGQLEQTRRAERSADGEQGQRRLFHLAVLPVKDLDTTPDVQSLSFHTHTQKQSKTINNQTTPNFFFKDKLKEKRPKQNPHPLFGSTNFTHRD